MTNTTCWLCKKPCNTTVLYLHRYAHMGCAETAYHMTPEGTHGLEEWRDRPTEDRIAELNAATGRRFE